MEFRYFAQYLLTLNHCVKSARFPSFFWSVNPDARKHEVEKAPNLNTFNAVIFYKCGQGFKVSVLKLFIFVMI